MVLPVLLGLLKFAPALFTAGKSIVEAVSGEPPPAAAVGSPEALADHISSLPQDQQAEIQRRLLDMKQRMQELDTERFVAMTAGDAEKLRSSARPEIALQAMAVISLFGSMLKWLGLFAIGQWVVTVLLILTESTLAIPSIWDELAKIGPVAELIWAPALGSLAACVQVITKYMGCRERDKAQEYEIRAGRPLDSSQATIEAAGGMVSSVIKALKR